MFGEPLRVRNGRVRIYMRVRVYTDDFLLLTPAQPPFLPAGLHLLHEAGRGDIVAPAWQRYGGEVRTSRNGHGEAGR